MLYLYFIFWKLGGQLLESLPFIFYIFSVHLCQDFYVFHLWALHIVTCIYKYICVSLYSVYVFMCVCF